jgi:hypothetical protein
MSNFLSHYTTYLANRLCGGSSRKLIAGWWYDQQRKMSVVSQQWQAARTSCFVLPTCMKVRSSIVQLVSHCSYAYSVR